ncbi:hypothetical protein [Arthrobacter sp. 9AX]|uniref:hypothetical protein n=1 Tax=Arthrobacter sp. 9AX TaxID=2653131 RepID=UPI002E2D1C8E|nr:hypothetical protein [Arthrobacter sp. 9AX]
MTENQWPQTPNPAIPEPYASEVGVDETYASAAAGTTGTSKTEAAKEQASNVAGQAATSAQGVAHTAKEEAANVASEAKHSAQDLLAQAKSGLSDQAGTQQQKAAEGIRNISSQLVSIVRPWASRAQTPTLTVSMTVPRRCSRSSLALSSS